MAVELIESSRWSAPEQAHWPEPRMRWRSAQVPVPVPGFAPRPEKWRAHSRRAMPQEKLTLPDS